MNTNKLFDFIFDWDDSKNKANIRKHGISFSEAITVFLDENAVLVADTEHSEHEARFAILGLNKKESEQYGGAL